MEKEEKNFQLYLLMRKERVELMNSASIVHDKYILGISSALLGFSITILRLLKVKNHICLLYNSWGLIMLTILLMIISFWLTQKFAKERIHSEENYYTNEKSNNISDSPFEIPLFMIRIIADFTFILSFIFLLIFSAINA